MKIEIAQDQQTTCNGIAVFQKCRQLFNKQGIGKLYILFNFFRKKETIKRYLTKHMNFKYFIDLF